MRYIDPSELSDLERAQRRRQTYQTYRAMASKGTADSVTSLARTYPTMRAGEVLPLAQAGVRPETPVAKAAAKASVKKGFGWHSVKELLVGDPTKAFDDAGTTLGRAIGGVAEAVPKPVKWFGEEFVADPLKGISRGMAIGLAAPGEAIQGGFRNRVADGDFSLTDAARTMSPLGFADWSQTTAAAGVDEIRREGVRGADYGSGFFAGGDVEKIQRERARGAAPLINGKAVTMGRYTAAQVSEPGTRFYGTLSGLIDASVAVAGDPTTFLGGASRRAIEARRTLQNGGTPTEVVARADRSAVERITKSADEGLISESEARRLLHEAGGLDETPRKTVLPEKIAGWLDGKQGRQLRDYLVAETDFARMRKNTGGKVDVETLVKLTDARSDAEVLEILSPKLGIQFREKFGVSKVALDAANGGNGFRVQRMNGAKSRLAAQMPGNHMDLEDVDRAVETTEKFLINANLGKMQDVAGMTGAKRIGYWAERMARTTDRNSRFAVTREMLAETRDVILTEQGANLTAGHRALLTRMYDDYDETLRKYAIDEVGENMAIPGAVIGGTGKPVPTPHLYGEYVNTAVPLPDIRELRRATSKFVHLVDKAGLRSQYDGTQMVADFITQQTFKPLVLFRGAWTVRVIGEEQIRMASSGLTSMFAHPLSHIAMATGKTGGKDITDDVFSASDELNEALSRSAANGFMKDSRVVRSKHRVVLRRGEPGRFSEALLDEVGKLSSDPVMRRVLNGLQPGDLHPNTELTGLDAVKDWFFNGTGRKFRDEMANADVKGDRAFLGVKTAQDGSIQSADGYIDSLLERAKTMAGGDQRLLDAMSSGSINGQRLTTKGPSGKRDINRAAIKEVQRIVDEGAGPNAVPADLLVHVKNSPASEMVRYMDTATEWMYSTLMSKPTNFLSRNPSFQQFYWKRQVEMIPRMTPETQQQAIRVAEETGLSDVAAKLRTAAKRGSGELNVADADLVAKGFALDSTRKLLYDLSDRSQFFDITRAIFPFGEAWKEVATTWARIGFTENPVALRRAQQVVTGLRSADTDGDGEGFFYTDENGEEVFNYPFSDKIGKWLTGAPTPLQATAKGLNIFSTSVIPGVGPVVQVPAGKLIPNTPEYDELRRLVLPFGSRDLEGGVLESFLPAWLNRALVAGGKRSPEQERLYGNAVMSSSAYLVSSGKYELNDPDLLPAAEAMAKKVYLYRSAAQFFVPSPPSPEFVAKDKDGELLYQIKLIEELRKLQDEDYTTAMGKFIDKHGEATFLATVAKTKSEGGGPSTDKLWEFIQRHPDKAREHEKVYGYFVESGGEFSYDAYRYQLTSGQRRPIRPQEAITLANQRLGGEVYRTAQSKVRQRDGRPAPTVDQRVWLAQVRDAIKEEYPGWDPTPDNLDEQKKLIDAMVRASRDPVLSQTEAGKGVALYVQERQRAIEIARSRGLTDHRSAKSAADIRAALRAAATQIGEEYPDFLETFDRTFNREMKSDAEQEES